MGSCQNTCQLEMPAVEEPEVTEAAEALACLLAESQEYQNFLRLSFAQERIQLLQKVIQSAD